MNVPAKSALPNNGAIAFVARGELFVEYPVKGGGPNYITSFPLTSSGLARALGILIENAAPEPKLQLLHPGVKRIEGATQAQRDLAASIVRQMLK